MLSYQHIYHAGNWADIHKHAILCAVWADQLARNIPLHFFDSHAGRGAYDLGASEALKTKEFQSGFSLFKPIRKEALFKDYLQAIQKWNPRYPGSPACVAAARGAHKMTLFELHPNEVRELRRVFEKEKGVTIFQENAHEALPKRVEKLGRDIVPVILIDPSYEVKDEYATVVQTVRTVQNIRPDAVILVWYCILKGKDYHAVLETGLHDFDHLSLHPSWEIERGMTGSIMAVKNLPPQSAHNCEKITVRLEQIFSSRGL